MELSLQMARSRAGDAKKPGFHYYYPNLGTLTWSLLG